MLRNRRLLALLAIFLTLGLVAAACGDDDDDTGDDTTTTTAEGGDDTTTTEGDDSSDTTEASGSDEFTIPTDLSATIEGSGATFPQAYYQAAIEAMKDVFPDITNNYGGGGSGKGRQDLADQITDWAGSDALPSDDEDYKGGEILLFPTVAAPITVSYNLSGVDSLQLDACTVAQIFTSQITTWDDPAIAATNEGVDLPSEDITLAVRSDSSGTTNNFSLYLSEACPDSFTLEPGSTVQWPGNNVQAGNGNGGVAQIISSTSGAVGYVDYSDALASGLSFAAIQDEAGDFVEPSVEATTAALDGITLNDDLSYNPLNSPAEGAYPIAAPTWIIIYQNQPDEDRGQAVVAWLEFIYSEQGQSIAPTVDFAPLPDSFIEAARQQLATVTIGGSGSDSGDTTTTSS